MSEEYFTLPSGAEVRITGLTPERLAKLKDMLTSDIHVIPATITEQLVALTDQRRSMRGKSGNEQAFIDSEARIEACVPGYSLVWNADIQAYGLFPDARCNGGVALRFDEGKNEQLASLFVRALYIEGQEHKQWYLWKLAELLGIDLADRLSVLGKPSKGIAP